MGGEYLYAFLVDTKTALVLGGGGITGGMYEPGALLFRVDHPDTDLLMIEPSPAESSVHTLERLAADRFLQQAAVPPRRRRFGMVRQESTASDRGVFR